MFGTDLFQRVQNIQNNKPDFKAMIRENPSVQERWLELFDLIQNMTKPDPKHRFHAVDVVSHIFFVSDQDRYTSLNKVSKFLQNKDMTTSEQKDIDVFIRSEVLKIISKFCE